MFIFTTAKRRKTTEKRERGHFQEIKGGAKTIKGRTRRGETAACTRSSKTINRPTRSEGETNLTDRQMAQSRKKKDPRKRKMVLERNGSTREIGRKSFLSGEGRRPTISKNHMEEPKAKFPGEKSTTRGLTFKEKKIRLFDSRV